MPSSTVTVAPTPTPRRSRADPSRSGDLEQVPAVHHRHQRAARGGGVARARRRGCAPRRCVMRNAVGGNAPPGDVGHQVAEAVDVDHLAGDRRRRPHGSGQRETLEVGSRRAERAADRCRWRAPRPPARRRRGRGTSGCAACRKKRSSVSSTIAPHRSPAGAASESTPLSGPTSSAGVGLDAQRAPLAARRPDRPPRRGWCRGKPRHGMAQHERAGQHVLRRNAVRHVHHRHARRARRDDALHDADPGIARARNRW